MKIWLDMDGTIANLYAVEGWLPMLRSYDPTPYASAEPLVNMSALARLLHNRQKEGYQVCIVTAFSKSTDTCRALNLTKFDLCLTLTKKITSTAVMIFCSTTRKDTSMLGQEPQSTQARFYKV